MRKKAQFGQVISGYVDPTPEGLNKAYERHMDNLLLSEQIRQQAATLKAAPFEGDKQLRRDLLTSSDDALQKIVGQASYGNLSNFTSAVTRASTEFQKGAAPIQQNRENYVNYQAQIDKLLEENKIDVQDANGAMFLSTKARGYNGLKYDENGELTGFFSGVRIYQNPDIQSMINEALSNVEPDSWREVRRTIAVGPDGSRTVETDQGEKYISAEKVNAALAGVFSDPRVTGYYNRKGEIEAATLEDDQVRDRITKMIDAQSSREEPNAQEIGRLQQLLESGDMEDMRAEITNTTRDQMLNTFRVAAISGKQSMEVTDIQKEGWDAWWMARSKQKLQDQADTSAIEVTENGMTYERIGGANAGDLAIRIDDTNKELESLMEQYQTGFNDLSDQGKEDLTNKIKEVERESRMMHNLFMDLYKNTPDELIDTEEYRELLRQAENPDFIFTGFGAAGGPGILQTLLGGMDARKNLRDYITNLELESPVGPTTTVSVQYVDPTTVGGGTDIAKSVKNHFSAGFNGEQIVFDPDTGARTTLADLAEAKGWGDLSEMEYANMGVSKGAPLATGPTMRVGIKTASGAQSIIIPIGPEGTQLNIPGVSPYYNSPGGLIVNEMLTYQIEGLEDIDTYYYSENEPSIRGKLSVDLTTAEGGTVTIQDLEGNVLHKMGLLDPNFQAYCEKYAIKIR